MKLGDLVKYRHISSEPNRNDFPMTNGLVVGFDSEDDPIVFFTCRKDTKAYYEDDIEVLNENG